MLTFLRKHASSGPQQAAKLSVEDLLKQEPPPESFAGRSRVCRTLAEVLVDGGAVSLLLQFLRPRGAAPLLLFWLEAARLEGRPPPWPSPAISDDRSEAAVAIFERFFAQGASERVSASRGLVDAVEVVIRRKEAPPKDIFHPLQEHVSQVLLKEHFDEFLQSEFYRQHQVEVLTSGQVHLADLLLNESALFYFTEFMEQDNHRTLLEFWLAATNFQKHPSSEPSEAQADAVVLYDKYFSLQATSPLGFGDPIRLEVEEKICGEFGPSADCFEKAAKIALSAMERLFLPDFLQSQLYLRYLADLLQASNGLINSTSNSNDSSQTSTCSWDDSDPDSIWKRGRHNSSGLSLGRIDELGRFEADFEPEPEARRESRLSRVMRRLVRPHDQEEVAWRVAEMIVRDVTSVTLGDAPSRPSPPRRPSTADS
ncbi:A-kinase anchor protein 10, mitochondrial isoform X2 [Neocloeon triangulifer]|uniref:A-kinase anchor protein 10, mitochondrial isoform X2 n=1 Tax=Neocloeon triangulifer TaxID=2078957 RepID=UPI00286F3D77|nr:A-kinase anchor protein 10, mitochondrial isoform X2 [Neocloeon triangulifer]